MRNGNILSTNQPIQIADQTLSLITELNIAGLQQSMSSVLLATLAPLILGALVFVVLMAIMASETITRPLARLQKALTAVSEGQLTGQIRDTHRHDEFGHIARNFEGMRDQIVELTRDMEMRLNQHEQDIHIAQNITHAMLQERDLTHLLNTVVQHIVDNFSQIYHAQVFLLG